MPTSIEKEFARLSKGAKNQQELDAAYQKALDAFKSTPSKPKRTRGPGRTWTQVGGDVNPKEHGVILAREDDSGVEVVRIEPNEEGRGWYRTTNHFFNSDLAWDGQAKAPSIARSIGIDRKEWDAMSNAQRAEAAMSYHGSGWSGDESLEAKWSDALPAKTNQIKWWK